MDIKNPKHLKAYIEGNKEANEFFNEELNTLLPESQKLLTNDRNEQYGDHIEAFKLYADTFFILSGRKILPSDIALVLKCVKLGRERYKHKLDNCMDMVAYESIRVDLLKAGL